MPRTSLPLRVSHTFTLALVGTALLAPVFAQAAPARPAACGPGRIVFSRFSDQGPNIYSMNACGGNVRRLTVHGGHQAEISPDGSMIAFSVLRPETHTSDIFIMRADGSGVHDVTNTADRNEAFPAWSPDGTQLAFAAEPPGSHAGQLYVMDLESGRERPITRPFAPREPGDPSWSPDGRKLVFDEFPEGSQLSQLWMVNVNGRDLHPVTPSYLDAFGPDWAPSGFIAFSSGATSPESHVWIMRPNGTGLRQLTIDKGGSSSELPVFSPDGRWISYTHILASGNSSVWKMRVTGQSQTPLTSGPADEYSDWGMSG